MKIAEDLLHNSILSQLCCHCGVCAGVCPTGAITCRQNVLTVDAQACVDCGLCTHCCPAAGYALSDHTRGDVVRLPKVAARANNEAVSADASSGGFVTQTLLTLLKNGDITAAAVVLCGDTLNESLARYVVTDDEQVVLAARRSKYTQATVDVVLQHIKKHDGRYAIVGLPCQLYGITKAMEKDARLRERIVYKLGMVCGYTYDEGCIDGLLKRLDTTRDEVERVLGWREGGLPGNFAVQLKDGTQRQMPFVDEHSIDVTYFAQNRCRQCRDCLCEHGDVVSADIGGWKNKRTLVLVRSVRGAQLMKQLSASDTLTLEPCDVPFDKTVLPFMLREKRTKVDLRLRQYRKRGLPTTRFIGGYTPSVMLANTLEMRRSLNIEQKVAAHRDDHSGDQLLKYGSLAYYKLSRNFWLKVLFKLQQYAQKAAALLKAIGGKVAAMLPSARKQNKALRAGIIGLGRWGAQYITFLKNSPDFRLVAAYDADAEKLAALSKKHGFAAAHSVDDLCTRYGVEAVFVLTPTPFHPETFNAVLPHGHAVYMEKPLAANSKAAAEMLKQAQEHGALLYVAHSMKYEPLFETLKGWLADKTYGTAQHIKVVRTVKERAEHYENDALYQIGVHLLDAMQDVFGDLNGSENVTRRASAVDNTETVTFRFGEVDCVLEYGFCSCYDFSVTVQTDRATLVYADGAWVVYINGGEQRTAVPMQNEKTVFAQLQEFYRAATQGRAYRNTPEKAQAILMMCDTILQAGESDE